ncbi:MAG: ParB/RepB/Spo0J family partition protein [Nitrososphaerales archaeon]
MQVGSVDLQRINAEVVVPLRVSEIRSPKFGMRPELGNLEELSRSILEKGILHPIIVRTIDHSSYEVVAGNRRLASMRELGRSTIPAIITNLNDQEAFEVTLTENVQRETLSPLEEARAFYSYTGPREKNCYEYGKISDLAKKIGKSQEYVSNRMRLLRLPETLLRQLFVQRHFTVSHAEELASLAENPHMVQELSSMILTQKISVRELERAVPLMKSGIETKRAIELAKLEADLKVDWNYHNDRDDRTQVLLKHTELILKSVLSYVDDVGSDLEHDRVVHRQWITDVRLKVHDAINGVISCKKLHNPRRKTAPSSNSSKR